MLFHNDIEIIHKREIDLNILNFDETVGNSDAQHHWSTLTLHKLISRLCAQILLIITVRSGVKLIRS